MEISFAQAVAYILNLPADQQRQFREMLMGSEPLQDANMPIIEA